MVCVKCGVNDLLTWCKKNGNIGEQIMRQWVGLDDNENSIDMTDVSFGSTVRVKWKCIKGHIWDTSVYSRTQYAKRGKISGCPICSKIKSSKHRSGWYLATIHMDLASWCNDNTVNSSKEVLSEWTGIDKSNNKVKMNEVSPSSCKMMKWKCKCGNIYEATIRNRVLKNNGCPICKNLD